MAGIIVIFCIILIRSCFSVNHNQRQIVLDIDENVPIGTRIVDLRSKLISSELKKAKFSLTTTNPYFTIRESSFLYTKGTLDRDKDRELCLNSEFPVICQWSSLILLDIGGYYYLKITINDVNDNPPQWEIGRIHLKIDRKSVV